MSRSEVSYIGISRLEQCLCGLQVLLERLSYLGCSLEECRRCFFGGTGVGILDEGERLSTLDLYPTPPTDPGLVRLQLLQPWAGRAGETVRWRSRPLRRSPPACRSR